MKLHEKNIAAIDIGTNSFHLIVVRVKGDGNFEIIDREKEVIRLSEGSRGDIKNINPEAIKRAVNSLKRFKGIADAYNASVRAVATSAVRESHNKNEFIKEVFDETGIEIEVISGNEEARLIYLGVLKAVPIFNKKSLVFDIGGGSTEFIIGKKGVSLYNASTKIGAVRLTQKFFPDFIVTDSRIKECSKWVEGELYQVVESIKSEGFQICAGSSGTIMSAGFMINAMRNKSSNGNGLLNNYEFTKDELEKIYKEVLSRKTVDKRKKIPGLDEKRVDIIPAGIIILKTIFEMLGIEKMIISGYALREGTIIDTLQKKHETIKTPVFEDIRKQSVKQLAESCRNDLKHSRHIADLALSIFDQLESLHKLDNECREYLEASAILHDVGHHISQSNHHHHSYYIIKNSELLGFNENEIDIIAHTARYHRKSHPKNSHNDFGELPFKTQNTIKKLSAILRVADSFDRTHKMIVRGLKCKVKGDKVELILEIKKNEDPEIELWNLERRKGLFEEVFNKKIVLKRN